MAETPLGHHNKSQLCNGNTSSNNETLASTTGHTSDQTPKERVPSATVAARAAKLAAQNQNRNTRGASMNNVPQANN